MKKNKQRTIIGGILFLLALITFLINYFFGTTINQLWLNLFSELIGISITVFIIENLLEKRWYNSDNKIAYEIEFILQNMADDFITFFNVNSKNFLSEARDINNDKNRKKYRNLYSMYVSIYLLPLVKNKTMKFDEDSLLNLVKKHYDAIEKALIVLSAGSSGYVLDAVLDLRMRIQRIIYYQTKTDLDRLINREDFIGVSAKNRLLTRLNEMYVSSIQLYNVINKNLSNVHNEIGRDYKTQS